MQRNTKKMLNLKEKCKRNGIEKYATDEDFRKAKKRKANEIYSSDETVWSKKKQKVKQIYHKNVERTKKNKENFTNVLIDFGKSLKDELQYVCCICHRLFFSYQVAEYNLQYVMEFGRDIYANALQSSSKKYLHEKPIIALQNACYVNLLEASCGYVLLAKVMWNKETHLEQLTATKRKPVQYQKN